jgi:hypothetical protein
MPGLSNGVKGSCREDFILKEKKEGGFKDEHFGGG